MKLTVYSGSVDTTGGAGVSAGTVTVPIPEWGYLEWVRLDFHASAATTTDTTIAYGVTPPGGNILVVTNSKTDATFYPRAGAVTAANAAITDSGVRFVVGGSLTVTLAQCDDLTGAVVAYFGVADR